jgi:hypothetical protein
VTELHNWFTSRLEGSFGLAGRRTTPFAPLQGSHTDGVMKTNLVSMLLVMLTRMVTKYHGEALVVASAHSTTQWTCISHNPALLPFVAVHRNLDRIT